MAGLGDVDGDTLSDVAVGRLSGSTESVFVYSGADGSLIHAFAPTTGNVDFGASVAGIGDLDFDGVPDLVIGAPRYLSSGLGGAIYAYSCNTGQLLFEQHDPSSGLKGFGLIVRRGGDLDGDARAEILVGSEWYGVWNGSEYDDVGAVWILDGEDGTILRSVLGTGSNFARGLTRISDVDGDALDDFAIGDFAIGRPAAGIGEVFLYSSATVALVRKFSDPARAFNEYGAALDGTLDFNADGVSDLVVGAPKDGPWGTQGPECGRATVESCVDGARLLELHGEEHQHSLGWGFALLRDRDGDGRPDVAVEESSSLSGTGIVRIFSGGGGHEIGRLDGTVSGDQFGASMVEVPDLDGDAIPELAIGIPGSQAPYSTPTIAGSVEIRSGASGLLLQTFTGPALVSRYGSALATGTDASGAVMLAIGAPSQNGTAGSVDFLDLTAGAPRFTLVGTKAGDQFGNAVSTVGDANGDGAVDWIVSAYWEKPAGAKVVGVVRLVSGLDGAVLRTWTDGYRVGGCSPGDLDLDGTPDLLLQKTGNLGKYGVEAFSGASGALLFSLASTNSNDDFGGAMGRLGDLNRDGVDDFVIAARQRDGSPGYDWGIVEIYSGATAALLYRFEGKKAGDFFGRAVSDLRPGTDGDLDGDSFPDLLFSTAEDVGFVGSGRVVARRLDDLLLQLTPEAASAGATVKVETRGGPAGKLIGLFVAAFDTTPLNQFLWFGTFNATGIASLQGTVPSGLSGHTLTLRSFAIGFLGKIVDTQEAVLTFL